MPLYFAVIHWILLTAHCMTGMMMGFLVVLHQVRKWAGNFLRTYRMFQACSQVLFVHKHKAVKLNAKIKDSRVSRIQMWREKNHIPWNTVLMHFLRKKKGRGRIASSVIENLLKMRPNWLKWHNFKIGTNFLHFLT